jgi:hypothetical protein
LISPPGPQLQERLAAPAASGRPLIIDLDRVTFIDAAGLRVQANAPSRAATHGASLHDDTDPGGRQPPAQRRNP